MRSSETGTSWLRPLIEEIANRPANQPYLKAPDWPGFLLASDRCVCTLIPVLQETAFQPESQPSHTTTVDGNRATPSWTYCAADPVSGVASMSGQPLPKCLADLHEKVIRSVVAADSEGREATCESITAGLRRRSSYCEVRDAVSVLQRLGLLIQGPGGIIQLGDRGVRLGMQLLGSVS